MKMNPYQTSKQRDRPSQGTKSQKSQLPIERDLEGPICSNCGSRRYGLVIRMVGGRYSGLLAALCRGCHEPRMLMLEDLLLQEMVRETEPEDDVRTNDNN